MKSETVQGAGLAPTDIGFLPTAPAPQESFEDVLGGLATNEDSALLAKKTESEDEVLPLHHTSEVSLFALPGSTPKHWHMSMEATPNTTIEATHLSAEQQGELANHSPKTTTPPLGIESLLNQAAVKESLLSNPKNDAAFKSALSPSLQTHFDQMATIRAELGDMKSLSGSQEQLPHLVPDEAHSGLSADGTKNGLLTSLLHPFSDSNTLESASQNATNAKPSDPSTNAQPTQTALSEATTFPDNAKANDAPQRLSQMASDLTLDRATATRNQAQTMLQGAMGQALFEDSLDQSQLTTGKPTETALSSQKIPTETDSAAQQRFQIDRGTSGVTASQLIQKATQLPIEMNKVLDANPQLHSQMEHAVKQNATARPLTLDNAVAPVISSLLSRPKTPLNSGTFYGGSKWSGKAIAQTQFMDERLLAAYGKENEAQTSTPRLQGKAFQTPAPFPAGVGQGPLQGHLKTTTDPVQQYSPDEGNENSPKQDRTQSQSQNTLQSQPKHGLPSLRSTELFRPIGHQTTESSLMGDQSQHTVLQESSLPKEQHIEAVRERHLPRILEAIEVKVTTMAKDPQLGQKAIVNIQDSNLGKLRMELTLKDSKLSVQLQHATPEIQAMLENSQSDLQQSLSKHGLSLDSFSSGTSGGGDTPNQGGSGGHKQGGGDTHEHNPDDANEPSETPTRRSTHEGQVDTVI